MHGFLGREGIPPVEFLQICREQISKFPNVRFHKGEIVSIQRGKDGFRAKADDGIRFRARVVLLATGVIDELPEPPGVEELYGTSVHHCPYCDGWEHRDKPVAVYGKGGAGLELAGQMLTWSTDVVYFSDGVPLAGSARRKLEKTGAWLIETKIAALIGRHGALETVALADGGGLDRKAMFFVGSQRQNCDLARKLGCDFKEGQVVCSEDAKRVFPRRKCLNGIAARNRGRSRRGKGGPFHQHGSGAGGPRRNEWMGER